MIINVIKGSGEGKTKLAAFDKALLQAGIGNYNLIYLSSMIPNNSIVEILDPNNIQEKKDEYGNKLYIVIAKKIEIETNINKEAWAGLGWAQNEEGKGIFAEHTAETEQQLIKELNQTLNEMIVNRKENYGEIKYSTCGIKCKDKPVCAIVAAVYKSESF